MLDQLDRFLHDAGRSRASFGLEARMPYGDGNPETWRKALEDWKSAGATHVSVNTMRRGFATPEAHLKALREFAKAAIGVVG